MFYIELARILQADNEREIEARLRHRQLVDAAKTYETSGVDARSSRTATTTQPNQPNQPNQRPASSGAVSR
jgi:hypothetical protein